MNIPDQPMATPHQIHTLYRAPAPDSRRLYGSNIPNGSSQMANPPCVILTRRASWKLLDSFARTGSDQSVAAVHRVLEEGLNRTLR